MLAVSLILAVRTRATDVFLSRFADVQVQGSRQRAQKKARAKAQPKTKPLAAPRTRSRPKLEKLLRDSEHEMIAVGDGGPNGRFGRNR